MAQASLPIAGEAMPAPADATSLKAKLRRAESLNKRRALLLVLPLFLFILVTFMIPIGLMLYRGVDNPEIVATIPRTADMLEDWQPPEPPAEEVFATLNEELAAIDDKRAISQLGVRLNYEYSGASSLMRKTARNAGKLEPGNYREQFLKIDKDWGDPELWAAIKKLNSPVTPSYFLAAVDMTRNVEGEIVAVPETQRIYLPLFWRTLWLSLVITFLTLLLGFPVAYLLAVLPLKTSNLLMILVLLPFWTSLLVRTTSWIVLLQSQGVINDILFWIGIIDDQGRLQMVYNKTGTVIAMTHILL
ncbi:MAG: ABC transporter permease, partial [Geminicoccaceae bacterium]|nr:ABC transporter permease [Geminicoccaceae bacterium]